MTPPSQGEVPEAFLAFLKDLKPWVNWSRAEFVREAYEDDLGKCWRASRRAALLEAAKIEDKMLIVIEDFASTAEASHNAAVASYADGIRELMEKP